MTNRAYNYAKEIIRTRSKALWCLLALAVLDGGLFLYGAIYQEPNLAELQNRWFAQRRMAGTPLLDKGTIYKKGNEDLAAWRDRIPPKKDLARVISELYEMCAANSVSIGGMTFKTEIIKSENLLAYSIGFSVSGKYASVKSFIADLGRLREMVIVDAVSLNNPKITEEQVALRVNLSVYLRLEG